MGRVWVCNTDVESEWDIPEHAEMPYRGIRQIIFNHFEEILLTGLDSFDTAILRKAPDPEFVEYLDCLGIESSSILLAGESAAKPWLPTSQLAAQDNTLINILTKQVADGMIDTLECFGVSKNIEQISRLSGLLIPYSGSELSKSISRKSFSRKLAKELGLHFPDGEICSGSKEIVETVKAVRFRNKGSPVVIKPDMGAAGKGQFLVLNPEDIDHLIGPRGRGDLEALGTACVVERWFPEATTVSYEFHVGKDGQISRPIIPRLALADKRGNDYGYIYPVKLEDKYLNEIKRASNVLADELRKRYHYHGPVRCDALILQDGRLFPMLELNARHSFFHFIDSLHNKLSDQSIGLFCWFFFRTEKTLDFAKFIAEFIGKELLFNPETKEGVIVPLWSTVKGAESIKSFDADYSLRRLFILIISESSRRAINAVNVIKGKLDKIA